MRYEWRWWYVLFVGLFACVASYQFDIKFLLQQIRQFKIVHVNQEVELAQLQAAKSSQYPSRTLNLKYEKLHPLLLADLMPLLQTNHLVLHSMVDQGAQTNNGIAMDALRLTVEGRFIDAERLLILLTQLHSVVLLNFSFKATSSQHTMFYLDLLLWQGVTAPQALQEGSFNMPNQNPMCFSKDELIAESANILLQRTPLMLIKMIGYIAAEKTAKALVLLPSGSIAEIELGMMVGIERAKVVAINEEGIIVLNHGKTISITREESYMHEDDKA